MKRKVIPYAALLLMIGVGAVTASLVLSPSSGESVAQPVELREYTAVTRDLAPGTFLESKDLEWREWSGPGDADAASRFYPEGSIKFESLAGAVLRHGVREGEFLSNRDIIRPGESAFLAAVLKPGKRAITIGVDDVTGGAGLLRPGNQVDVILTGKLDGRALQSAKTLLNDVRVIAVNRDFEQVGSRRVEEDEERTSRRNKGTITLEVSPKEVEVITVAKTVGELSLSLRSLGGGEAACADDPADKRITSAMELLRMEEERSTVQRSSIVTTMYGTEQNRLVTK
jgi:pilus assembly protein CpaB